ncbi:hypothetical protein SPHINGOAX6_50223 [Sphingomonas sp. AX6]|nr:hypothetical protein SPHINGOAX6_50223 [Sphingomonas sp. AX6]
MLLYVRPVENFEMACDFPTALPLAHLNNVPAACIIFGVKVHKNGCSYVTILQGQYEV